MAYGGFNYVNGRRRGSREELSNKHQIPPESGDEQADAERGCRTRLAKPKVRTRTGKYCFSSFS